MKSDDDSDTDDEDIEGKRTTAINAPTTKGPPVPPPLPPPARADTQGIKEYNFFGKALTVGFDNSIQSTGASVWSTGPMLLRYLQRQPKVLNRLVVGKRILEIGAGVGLVGISLASVGAAEILLTDQECCIHLMNENIKRNSDSISCKIGVS